MSFNSPESPGNFFNPGVAADTVIQAGELVSLNAAGTAIPAADTASTRVIGRAEEDADNTGGSASAIKVLVKRGIFRFDNDPTNPVTIASIGLVCYVKTSTSVAVAAGPTNDIKAGLVMAVDADGVWVDTAMAPAL
jgi:hypothetical protein